MVEDAVEEDLLRPNKSVLAFSSTSPFVNLTFRQPHLSSTSPFVNLTFRQPHLSSTSPFVNLTFRQPHFSSTSPFVNLTFPSPSPFRQPHLSSTFSSPSTFPPLGLCLAHCTQPSSNTRSEAMINNDFDALWLRQMCSIQSHKRNSTLENAS